MQSIALNISKGCKIVTLIEIESKKMRLEERGRDQLSGRERGNE